MSYKGTWQNPLSHVILVPAFEGNYLIGNVAALLKEEKT